MDPPKGFVAATPPVPPALADDEPGTPAPEDEAEPGCPGAGTEPPDGDEAGPEPCGPAAAVPLVFPPAETAGPLAGLPVLATEPEPDWVAGTTANTTRARATIPTAAAP